MDISSLRERPPASLFSVSELNNYIKSIFDNNQLLRSVSVHGEISNFKDHSSGHLYFVLKDGESQIKAVMFKAQRLKLKFRPEDGMKVRIHGSVSIYAQGGVYQIYVGTMEPEGIGALYLAYEQLKSRLEAEGLFDVGHKQSIPSFCSRIGVITSPTGAAVRDVINVIGRRFPLAEIYLYPSQVQGAQAEADLIKAIDFFDRSALVDLIIIGRGGGSIEDLWAFNSEALARRIYSCNIPVISAVGHETDFTICDFVSDLRAPTPSAAAEISVPDLRDISIYLCDLEQRLSNGLINLLHRREEQLSLLKSRSVFLNFESFFDDKEKLVSDKYSALLQAIEARVNYLSSELAVHIGKTDALSPLSVLSRGYSICEGEDGVVLSSESLSVNDEVNLIFSDGNADALITKVNKR